MNKIIKYQHRSNKLESPIKYRAMEIDVKSNGYEIVLGHNWNVEECSLEEFLKLCDPDTELAINIKQSGLCVELERILSLYNIKSYFYFDQAVPDLIEYLEICPEHTAIRLSEYEIMNDAIYKNYNYGWIWFDIFNEGQYLKFDKEFEFPENKRVVVCMPSLHNSKYQYKHLLKSKNIYGYCED
jgi:hypothetical protein